MIKKSLGLAVLLLFAVPVFAQRTLDSYLASAKLNSPLIKDNENQKNVNRLEIDRLKAQYRKPGIGFNAAYNFSPIVSTDNGTHFEPNPHSAQQYYGYDLALTNGGLYQGLATITQPLFNGGRFNAYADQVNTASLVNQNNIQLAEHDIEKYVTDQYLLCLLDQQQSKYFSEMVTLLGQQRTIVEKLMNAALLKQSDLNLLNIEYDNFQNQLLQSNANYRRNLMDLNILAGISDTANFQLDSIDVVPRLNTNSSSSQYLQKFHLDSLSLAATQRVFETKYMPQVSLFANSGVNGSTPETLYRRFGIGGGVNVAFTLYDGRQRAITRKKTDLLQQSVGAYRDNFLAVNDVRKNKYLTELKSYDERALLLQQQLNEYDQVLSAYRRELLSGQQSVINFINVVRNMGLVERDYTLLKTNRLLLINAYNYWNW